MLAEFDKDTGGQYVKQKTFKDKLKDAFDPKKSK